MEFRNAKPINTELKLVFSLESGEAQLGKLLNPFIGICLHYFIWTSVFLFLSLLLLLRRMIRKEENMNLGRPYHMRILLEHNKIERCFKLGEGRFCGKAKKHYRNKTELNQVCRLILVRALAMRYNQRNDHQSKYQTSSIKTKHFCFNCRVHFTCGLNVCHFSAFQPWHTSICSIHPKFKQYLRVVHPYRATTIPSFIEYSSHSFSPFLCFLATRSRFSSAQLAFRQNYTYFKINKTISSSFDSCGWFYRCVEREINGLRANK